MPDKTLIRRICSYGFDIAIRPPFFFRDWREDEGCPAALDLDVFAIESELLGDPDGLGAARGEHGAFHSWIYVYLLVSAGARIDYALGILSSYRDLMI